MNFFGKRPLVKVADERMRRMAFPIVKSLSSSEKNTFFILEICIRNEALYL